MAAATDDVGVILPTGADVACSSVTARPAAPGGRYTDRAAAAAATAVALMGEAARSGKVAAGAGRHTAVNKSVMGTCCTSVP
ncbi:hypothetical protein EON68_03020, partial [archaeon]